MRSGRGWNLANSGLARAATALWALALCLALHAWQAHAGLNLADEGYLWYGAQRTLQGEAPIRDFMAYDIGRYYWSAAVMRLAGDDGVVALRLAIALFEALGLAAALAWLRDVVRPPALLAVAAVVVVAWLFPRHKGFDAALALWLVATLAWLLEAPDRRRCFLAGLSIGVVALFGRNHGAYGGLAALAACALNAHARRGPPLRESLPLLSAGVVAGYLPMLAWLVVDPAMRAMFVEDLRQLFAFGATNLARPVPWPHRAFAGGAAGWDAARGVAVGLLFVALLAFPLAGAWRVLRDGATLAARAPVFVACVLLALPYAHFAFSRADLPHLAQGIFPLLLGVLAWPRTDTPRARGSRVAVLALAVAATALVALPQHPGWRARDPRWVAAQVGADTLRVEPGAAAALATARTWLGDLPRGSRAALVAPTWVAVYPALGLAAPNWEIYPLFPRDTAFQQAEIARLEAAGVRVALIEDRSLDGDESLRWSRTHDRVHAWLESNFERADPGPGRGRLEVFVRPGPR